MTWYVTCFYEFVPLAPEALPQLRTRLLEHMTSNDVRGLVLLAPEGINGTVAGTAEAIADFKQFVVELIEGHPLRFKDSESETRPFRRCTVDLRKEIVALKQPDRIPKSVENNHLTPAEWHAMLASDQPLTLIDTRNDYEVAIGKFKGAIDPGLKSFSDWASYLDSAEINREEPVLIYCTGGIRCEKAILEMKAHGLERVYQLRDGILGYLAEYPNGFYEGDCYVFDERVALDQHLQPSTTVGNCPGCGLPGLNKRTCVRCHEDYFVCDACLSRYSELCSKACVSRWNPHAKRKKATV